MNLTSSEAHAWFRTLLPLLDGLEGRDVFVLPPFTSIWVAREQLRGTSVSWGAQDVHSGDSGAHTGDISASMLADLDCRYVEVGHSERRRDHAETPEIIASKIAAVLRHEMHPLLCVGEAEAGSLDATIPVLLGDLERCLGATAPSDLPGVVIAYEPQWAIGEGAQPAPIARVTTTLACLREWLTARTSGGEVRLLYGGSVDEAAAENLLSQAGVDGLFVGRRALDPVAFARICWAGVDASRRYA